MEDGEIEDWIMEIAAITESYEDINIKDVSKNKAERIRSTIGRLKSLKNNLEKKNLKTGLLILMRKVLHLSH